MPATVDSSWLATQTRPCPTATALGSGSTRVATHDAIRTGIDLQQSLSEEVERPDRAEPACEPCDGTARPDSRDDLVRRGIDADDPGEAGRDPDGVGDVSTSVGMPPTESSARTGGPHGRAAIGGRGCGGAVRRPARRPWSPSPRRNECGEAEHLGSPVLVAERQLAREGREPRRQVDGVASTPSRAGEHYRCSRHRRPSRFLARRGRSRSRRPRRPRAGRERRSPSTIRRVPAFVQLPGPHGSTVRSWLIASTTVAEPYPLTVPLAVLISWTMPRSATRFVIDALVSVKVARKSFAP